VKTFTDNNELRDVVVLGDFNLPKVKWKVDEESGSMMPLNVTSDLESDLISGLFGCDLGQINEKLNKNGTFLDLVFIWLLKMLKHLCSSWIVTKKSYEIEMQIC
jgi:hypothetical protein